MKSTKACSRHEQYPSNAGANTTADHLSVLDTAVGRLSDSVVDGQSPSRPEMSSRIWRKASLVLTDTTNGIFRGPYMRVRTPFCSVNAQ